MVALESRPKSPETEKFVSSIHVGISRGKEVVYNSDSIKSRVGDIEKVYRASETQTLSSMLNDSVASIIDNIGTKQDFVGVSTSFPNGTHLSTDVVRMHSLETDYVVDSIGACSGGTYILVDLYNKIKEHKFDPKGKHFLFASTEKYSPYLDPESLDAHIFTDIAVSIGGLEYGRNFEILGALSRKLAPEHDGSLCMPVDKDNIRHPALYLPVPYAKSGLFEMDGPTVYKVVKGTVLPLLGDAAEEAHLRLKDLDYFIFHQGSGRTNDGLIKAIYQKFPAYSPIIDKIVRDIFEGNASSGSGWKAFGSVLARHRQESIPEDTRNVAFVSFGAGIYGAAAIVQMRF